MHKGLNNNLIDSIRLLSIIILSTISCAYFNTFYNAQSYYHKTRQLVTNDTLKVDSDYFDKTIEKATSLIVKYPNSRWVDDALFMMGVSYYFKGDYPRALEKFDYLLLNYPETGFYDDALYYKGLTYFKQNNLSKAVIALKEAAESKAYKKNAGIILLYIYKREKNYEAINEQARQLLELGLSKKEKNDVLEILGEAQFNQKEYTKALDTYNKMLEITKAKTKKDSLKLKIARIYLQVGKYDICKKLLEPEHSPPFRLLLGDLNLKLNNKEKAEEIYHKVTKEGGGNFSAQAYYKLARLYEETDSIDKAIAYYDSSLNKSVTDEYALEAKKKADILRKIKELQGKTEDPAGAKFHLAEIYFTELNDINRALKFYRTVTEDYPGSKWASKALYARFWITKNIVKNDSAAGILADELFKKYPDTEYAISARKILGIEQ